MADPSITIDARSVAGDTPLIVAAKNGHLEIMKKLVENGAEVNLANDHGNTALHYTCFFRFKECTIYLVQRAGARIHVVNK